jgi:hypothetical protein
MRYLVCRGALTAVAALMLAGAALALPFQRGQRDLTLVAGYGENHRFPACMKTRIRFDQTSLRWGRFTSPANENAFEVGMDSQVKGQENLILSAVASRRHYFLVKKNIAVGYDLAFGAARFEHAVSGLATRLNFTEQVGLVLQHKVGASSALTLQYRFCHMSNAGIKKPNVGVNASVLSLGLTWFL